MKKARVPRAFKIGALFSVKSDDFDPAVLRLVSVWPATSTFMSGRAFRGSAISFTVGADSGLMSDLSVSKWMP